MDKNIGYMVAILVFLCGSACYSPKDGCTDIYASNYDASADELCCCKYPNISYQNRLVLDSVGYGKDTIFHDLQGRPFYVNRFVLAGHDIKLGGRPGLTFKDTIRISASSSVSFPTILILDAQARSHDLRTLRNVVTVNSEEMKLGMPEEIDRVSYENVPSAHVLDKYELLYDSLTQKWYDGVIDIIPDTLVDDMYRLYLEDLDVEVLGDLIYQNNIGGNVSVTSELNLSTIFKGLDLNDPKESQVEHITNGLSKSFYFTE